MNRETKVGLFVILSLVALLPAILFIGNIKLFKRSVDYYAEFKDVEALPPKAAVKVAGVEIGKVGKIRLKDGKAVVTLGVDPSVDIYENATARVGSTGLIGTRFIEIELGDPSFKKIEPGATIEGLESAGLQQMMSKLSSLFERDGKNGDAVENLKVTLANIRRVSDSLNSALGQREKELEQIVLNIRDMTAGLKDIVETRKEDVKVALGKFRDISEKIDSILTKIQKGEGTIGTLVSDEKTAEDVKQAINSIKDTAKSAQSVLGRFRSIKTYWDYHLRYDTRDDDARSDLYIKFVPSEGKFYKFGVTNLGEIPSNEKSTVYERHNRITAVMGADWGPFTGYAGAIRSDGGVGVSFRPLWFNKNWERKVELDVQAADFERDRVVLGNRLDRTWLAAGGSLSLTRWLWIGASVEDILERSAFMTNLRVAFEDKDLAYLLGLASVAR